MCLHADSVICRGVTMDALKGEGGPLICTIQGPDFCASGLLGVSDA